MNSLMKLEQLTKTGMLKKIMTLRASLSFFWGSGDLTMWHYFLHGQS